MSPALRPNAKPGSSSTYRPVVILSSIALALSIAVTLTLVYLPAPKISAVDLPPALPELQFKDAEERMLTLADFRGRVILLNIWATWCAPCRKEMPDLDRLEGELGGPDLEVVALSIDRGGLERVKPFFDEIGIRRLAIYLDQSAAMSALAVTGVPTTLLIDRGGREVRRWAGPVEWNGKEMVALLRRQIGENNAVDTRRNTAIKPDANQRLVVDGSIDAKGKIDERIWF